MRYALGMLFKWLLGEESSRAPTASDELKDLVARSMPQADAEQASIVAAVAGLMAAIVHADRQYTSEEREQVRAAFERIHCLRPESLEAVERLFEVCLTELANEPLQTYTRVLYERLTREARLEVLEALLELAAADDVLDMAETNLLRRVARALGLSDDEYVAIQSRHRARLSVLTPRGTPNT